MRLATQCGIIAGIAAAAIGLALSPVTPSLSTLFLPDVQTRSFLPASSDGVPDSAILAPPDDITIVGVTPLTSQDAADADPATAFFGPLAHPVADQASVDIVPPPPDTGEEQWILLAPQTIDEVAPPLAAVPVGSNEVLEAIGTLPISFDGLPLDFPPPGFGAPAPGFGYPNLQLPTAPGTLLGTLGNMPGQLITPFVTFTGPMISLGLTDLTGLTSLFPF